MGFIIGGMLGLALTVGTIWLAIYLFTHRDERRRWAAEERSAALEKLLRTPGARLHCVACGLRFVGPMPEDGCPGCQCAAFVTADTSVVPAPTEAAETRAATADKSDTADKTVTEEVIELPDEAAVPVRVGSGGGAA